MNQKYFWFTYFNIFFFFSSFETCIQTHKLSEKHLPKVGMVAIICTYIIQKNIKITPWKCSLDKPLLPLPSSLYLPMPLQCLYNSMFTHHRKKYFYYYYCYYYYYYYIYIYIIFFFELAQPKTAVDSLAELPLTASERSS